MSQQIEIEFKNLLTKEEFTRLQLYFKLEQADFRKQDNHYFDTTGFTLKQNHSALRIRYKDGKYEMTLKEPLPEGLLETNEPLNMDEAHVMLNEGKMKDGEIKSRLEHYNVKPDDLHLFGTLTTERAETKYLGGIVVLDYSSYLNTHDYEIEYEVDKYDEGKEVFYQLLQLLNIPVRKTDNKIRRFYNQKFKNN